MILPNASRVQGFNQTQPATNLPFGPQTDNIVYQYYSDFSTMFSAFSTGGASGLDLTDWPLFASDSGIVNPTGSFCDSSLHPDWYCGTTDVNFGLFQVDVNHDRAFLGVNQLQARPATTVHVTTGATSTACSTGQGSVTAQLANQETNLVDGLFDVNNMTLTQVLSGGVLGGSTTIGGTGHHGLYSFPCVVAGTYLLSNSAYSNCGSASLASCEVTISSNTNTLATFLSSWKSSSTQQYTQAGIYIRQAVRHLLDKPKFILSTSLQGQATCTDIYAAKPQGFTTGFCANPSIPLPADVLKAECPALSIDPTLACNPIDAYLLNSTAIGSTKVWWGFDPVGTADNGFPSEQDIRASCDLFVRAGFSLTPSGATCAQVAAAAQGTSIPSSYPHLVLPASGAQIIFYDRTHPPRRAFGQITLDGLNFLFGTANNGANQGGGNPAGAATCAINYGFKSPGNGCTPEWYGFSEISDIIFADGLNAQTWNLYTGGESFSINPDNEYTTFNSVFASNYCGGAVATVISDYDIACDPKLDAYTSAGEFADSFAHSVNILQNATYVSTLAVSANPVYNLEQRFVGLNCLNFGNTATSEGSIISGLGTGWQAGTVGAFSTLLNTHINENYVPSNSAYACQGKDGTIRRGQSQDSDSFNPITATSVWDFDVIDEIWDTMLYVNPNTGGGLLQLSNWMVVSHASNFVASEVSTSPGLGTVVGTTTQVWHLRPDIQFHDGTQVTADDVCFTLLVYRDVPAALLQPSVINMATCTAINASTVQVKLGLSGPFYDDLIGGVPILPHHVWGAACSWPVGTPEPSTTVLGASNCANPGFDPMAAGLMIGSGPFECLTLPGAPSGLPAGTPGGTCSQTAAGVPAGQSLGIGASLLLTENKNYHRGPVAELGSKYHKFSWADKFGAGIVSIADISDAALHFKHYDPYWSNSLFSSTQTCSAAGGPGTGTLYCVDAGVISTIALYNHIGAWDPISLSSVVAADPHLNRFGSTTPGGDVVLQSEVSGNTVTIVIADLATSANKATAIQDVQADVGGVAEVAPTSCTALQTNAAPGTPAFVGPNQLWETCTWSGVPTDIGFDVVYANGYVLYDVEQAS